MVAKRIALNGQHELNTGLGLHRRHCMAGPSWLVRAFGRSRVGKLWGNTFDMVAVQVISGNVVLLVRLGTDRCHIWNNTSNSLPFLDDQNVDVKSLNTPLIIHLLQRRAEIVRR